MDASMRRRSSSNEQRQTNRDEENPREIDTVLRSSSWYCEPDHRRPQGREASSVDTMEEDGRGTTGFQ